MQEELRDTEIETLCLCWYIIYSEIKLKGEQKAMIDRTKVKADITVWQPKSKDIITEADGKIFIVHFEKLFPKVQLEDKLNKFIITKSSYDKQLGIISRYFNYFVAKYDKDNELLMSYLTIKHYIDVRHKFTTADDMYKLIDFIYDVLFTPTIIEEIKMAVEDNYLDDIENNPNGKKYTTGGMKHLENLEFTNEHIKILLSISYAMKLMSPIMLHYFSIAHIKLTKESPHIYEFYKRLFVIFSEGTGVNIYNKVFTYVKNKVQESYSQNEKIFSQRQIFGKDNTTLIKLFVQKVLISENMVKFKFNENWDPQTKKYKESVTGFIKTIIKYQNLYFLKEQYVRTLIEVTHVKNADGLSGIDKMHMTQRKLDEGECTLMECIEEDGVQRIKNAFDIEITQDEVEYYKANWKPEDLQITLIRNFYAKYFGGVLPTNIINRENSIILALLLKKKLIIEAGFEKEKDLFIEDTILPYVLTGNKLGKTNTRVIRNGKFLSEAEENYLYKRLNEEHYGFLDEIDPEFILRVLSMYSNTTFTYCCYEAPELLGVEINCDRYKFIEELLFLLNRM